MEAPLHNLLFKGNEAAESAPAAPAYLEPAAAAAQDAATAAAAASTADKGDDSTILWKNNSVQLKFADLLHELEVVASGLCQF